MAPMHLSKTPREDFILKPVAMLCKAFVSFKSGYLMRKGRSQFEMATSTSFLRTIRDSMEVMNI
ncbi:hypothetical protein GUITHDRAFT_150242 [Guillardia theta CCMP2712]|uniref:Uncharacterized protein n=1 Tax=Guillardia theta (strain CCMP2712) TaxID=905079 RepID=L1JZL5_GUITC|nr:hypothetical protein GUITHDRAFT_150242 [Guillardia theta CCMP2712]EKX53650.1 hypothetical protein GUITHDRAFT_150242 [Guillardia theta CCMP2712]|eukprot:XP_005840630.1 hypothetical protein GUITHDRAFT_150242 [Guillardia theta CCMP2712]